MTKSLRFLIAFVAVVTMLSSCKKAAVTDVSILTSHKWSYTSATETYSDSGAITHNLFYTNSTCTQTGYTEFHDYATNSALRLAYSYNTSQCPGYYMPSVGISSWNIDPDNTILYLNGNTSDGTGGSWYTIKTLNNSSIVLTNVYQTIIGYTGQYPNQTPVYHTITDTYTYTAQ
jgi:predicted nucleic-acid-binding Zn-ribbon protein